jgi:phage nucleotide-binding protein
MVSIKKANEIELPNTVSVLIYGNPGSGKTTMATSMPKSLLFDLDRGVHRALSKADVVQVQSLNDVNEILNGQEVNEYQTLIFDTLGRLIDLLCADIMTRNKSKMRLKDWGDLKIDFDNILRLIRAKNKNVVFIAHETEEKVEVNGKTVIVKRPDMGGGSSGKSLIKDLDLIGYVRIQDKRPIISFNPDDNYYAKNGYNIADDVIIPRIQKGDNNLFLTKLISEKVQENNKLQKKEESEYAEFIEFMTSAVDNLYNITDFNSFYNELPNKKHINNSLIVIKKKLKAKADSLKYEYDMSKKIFIDTNDKKEKDVEKEKEEKSKDKPKEEKEAV